jgi:hypothetical protein
MKKQIREVPLDVKVLRQPRQVRLEALLFSGGGLSTSLLMLAGGEVKIPKVQGE